MHVLVLCRLKPIFTVTSFFLNVALFFKGYTLFLVTVKYLLYLRELLC